MKCVKCSKTFETPLMLYSGKTACPFCGEPLAVAETFEVTAETEEYYRLAELAWFRYLENTDKPEYIKKCVEYCVRAAHSGHPRAVLRLGYLYETGYASSGLGRIECGRIASGYYTSLCFFDKQVKSDINSYDEESMAEVKTLAAKRLWNIVSKVAGAKAVAKPDGGAVRELKSKLVRIFPTVKFSDVDVAGDMSGTDLSSKLDSCFDKTRAPVFGVIRLTAAELKANSDEILDRAHRGLDMYHVVCGAGGEVDGRAKDSFNSLSNRKRIVEYIGAMESDGYLYFFNDNGKHPYLNRQALEKIRDELADDGRFGLVKTLVNKGGRDEYTFYDDDLFVFGTAQKLINDVIAERKSSLF